MKTLKNYIIEATSTSSEKDFFKLVYKNIQELEDTIEPNPDDLKKPNNGIFDQDDITDGFFQKILFDKKHGLVTSTKIIKNESLLEYDEEKNMYEAIYTPYICNVDGKDYFAGLLIFDVKSVIIKGYVNLISIETPKIIKNDKAVCSAIFEKFVEFISEQLKRDDIIGICAKPALPAISTILRNCGMKTFSKDKNFLIYDF